MASGVHQQQQSRRRQTIRPYIKPSFRLDYHTEHNSAATSGPIICAELAEFMKAHGFSRPSKKRGKKEDGEKDKECEKHELMKGPPIGDVHLGLRSVFRVLNKRTLASRNGSFTSATTGSLVSLVLLDSDFVKPTAVSHLFALLALGSNSPSFFLLPNLSISLANALNLPRLSAIAFDDNSELTPMTERIRQLLKPIGLTKKSETKTEFVTPQLVHPMGRLAKKRAKKKKKAQKRS